MLRKIYRHLQKHIKKKDDPNVLLLRLLLLTLIVGVTYLIFKPQQIRPHREKKTLLLNGEKIIENEAFRMSTTHLCAAVVDAQLRLLDSNRVEITFLKKQNGAKQFVPLTPPATYSVTNADCIAAYPACEGMNFQYCFTIDTTASPPTVDYTVK